MPQIMNLIGILWTIVWIFKHEPAQIMIANMFFVGSAIVIAINNKR